MDTTNQDKLDKLAGFFERSAENARHRMELADRGIQLRQQQIRDLLQESDLETQLCHYNLQCRKLVEEIIQMQSNRKIHEQDAIVWSNLLAYVNGEREL